MSIKKNSIWNLAGMGFPLLIGVITIPFLIRELGAEAFGILTLIWSLIGYFSLFDFGLGRALTQQVAEKRIAKDSSGLAGLIKAGLRLTFVTGIIGGCILAVLSNKLATNWLGVNPRLEYSTFISLLIASVGIPITTLTSGLRGVLEGYEDFSVVNFLRVLLGVANFILPVISILMLGKSLEFIVGFLIASRVIILFFHVWFVFRRVHLIWFSSIVSRREHYRLFSYGAWMSLSNVISPLMVTADRFFISAVLGVSVVAYYTVPFEMMIRILVIPVAIGGALFPRLASLVLLDPPAARVIYMKSLKVLLLVLAPLTLLIIIFSKYVLYLWLGEDFAEHSWLIVCILAVGIFSNGIAFMPFTVIQASGDARTTAMIHLLEMIIYIPLLLFLLHTVGLIGAAIAWSVRTTFDAVLLFIFSKRCFRVI